MITTKSSANVDAPRFCFACLAGAKSTGFSRMVFFSVILTIGVLLVGCGRRSQESPGVPKEKLTRFAERKEAQARLLTKQEGARFPGEANKFFAAAESGDWLELTNYTAAIQKQYFGGTFARQTNAWDRMRMYLYSLGSRVKLTPTNYWPNMRGPQWQPILEVGGAVQAFQKWNPELLMFFATNVMNSIPSNSIYFGASEEGRFVVSALCADHIEGEPFFTLTQNALADPSYRHYLAKMYGKKLVLPTDAQAVETFSEYMQEVQKRAKDGKLLRNETYSSSSGRVSIGGTGAVMEISGKLVKLILAANTNCEFFIEQTEPIEWMYPHLEPHGLIMRFNREPLARLDERIVQADRRFWTELVKQFTGLDINDGASALEVTDYAKKIYKQKDLAGFKGDTRFIHDAKAQERFGGLRLAIAGVYAWRARQATDEAERVRMMREAELAFRQASLLNPQVKGPASYSDWLLTFLKDK